MGQLRPDCMIVEESESQDTIRTERQHYIPFGQLKINRNFLSSKQGFELLFIYLTGAFGGVAPEALNQSGGGFDKMTHLLKGPQSGFGYFQL